MSASADGLAPSAPWRCAGLGLAARATADAEPLSAAGRDGVAAAGDDCEGEGEAGGINAGGGCEG